MLRFALTGDLQVNTVLRGKVGGHLAASCGLGWWSGGQLGLTQASLASCVTRWPVANLTRHDCALLRPSCGLVLALLTISHVLTN